MDDKIKEVMGLVVAMSDADFAAGVRTEKGNYAGAAEKESESSKLERLIESKLRELVQPSTVGLTFEAWFQLRLDSLRRQNEWRKIDCLLASKEYVRDAWDYVPDGFALMQIMKIDVDDAETPASAFQYSYGETK